MEKNPAERIQTAEEVAERLAPWASDDSLLLSEEPARPRWMPAPIESVDDQDTDPSDIASLAMSELSDGAQSSIASPTIGIGDPGQDTGSFISSTGKPAPPQPSSISGQYLSLIHI